MRWSRLYNPIMKWLLRSPLHGLISSRTMLVTYTGRKSGRQYAVPVGYVRQGDTLLATSLRRRTWWRNLRGGAQVKLLLKGQAVTGRGESIADDRGRVADVFKNYMRMAPRTARYFQITSSCNGKLCDEDVARAIQGRVMIRFQLN